MKPLTRVSSLTLLPRCQTSDLLQNIVLCAAKQSIWTRWLTVFIAASHEQNSTAYTSWGAKETELHLLPKARAVREETLHIKIFPGPVLLEVVEKKIQLLFPHRICTPSRH